MANFCDDFVDKKMEIFDSVLQRQVRNTDELLALSTADTLVMVLISLLLGGVKGLKC